MVSSTGVLERRDLQQLEARVLKVPEGELVGRTLFHVDTSVNPGAETVAYDVLTRSGVAKIIANGATDLPLVNVDYTRQYNKVVSIGLGAEYTLQELRAAAMANRPIQADKMDAVRRGMSELENKLIFVGDAEAQINGFTNVPGVQLAPFAQPFANSTSDQILDGIGAARSKAKAMPGFEESNYNLVLPTNQFEYLGRTRYGQYDARTLLEIITDYKWFNKIVSTQAMVGVGAAASSGGSATDAAAIVNVSEDVAEIKLASDTTLLTPETYALYTKVGAEMRTGGVAVKIPYQIVRIDNI